MPFGRPLNVRELREKAKSYAEGSKNYNFLMKEAKRKERIERHIRKREKRFEQEQVERETKWLWEEN